MADHAQILASYIELALKLEPGTSDELRHHASELDVEMENLAARIATLEARIDQS